MKKVGYEKQLGFVYSFIIMAFLIFGLLGLVLQDVDNSVTNEELDESMFKDENKEPIPIPGSFGGYITYPPDPTPFTIIQPDGYEFTAHNVGERIGGHTERMDGYTIIKDGSGWWTFAKKDEHGVLSPTKHKVGHRDPRSIFGLEKHLSNDHPEAEKSSGYSSHSTRAPPINTTWKAIAIMLEFQDETFDPGNDQAHFEDLLNSTSGSSMRTYFQEVSYGQFDIEVDVVGPFQSAHVMAHYGDNQGGGRDNANGSISEMAKEAVQLADPTVDFSPYDLDSDTWIDALFIIHAGSGEEQSSYEFDIWSHKSSTAYFTGDGVFAGSYSTEPEDGRIGVFAHEFGHVLGLPDLYDTDYSSNGIGRWGIMGGGSWNGGGNTPAHFSAWSKVTLGWVEPQIVTSDLSLSQLEIPPVENNTVIYKIWAHDPSQNTAEYFLVENRQLIGFDSALPGDGILIWHIDETVPSNNDESHYKVDLEEADGDPPNDAADAWENTLIGFRNTTTPNSSSYNGSETFVWVWNISGISPGGNMSVGFNEIYSGPVGIFISDPVSDTTINPVYDFIINDTGFPDEDVGNDSTGNSGSYILEFRQNGTSDPFIPMSPQDPLSWVGGSNGIINCTALPEGFWDFRLNITDEEGHKLISPIVYNIAVPSDIPPVADAGPDNLTDVNFPTVLDGSGSTDNSGFIAWFNWTFADGTYHNGTDSIVVHSWNNTGVFEVILNVTDSFGNWNIDTVNITVEDMGPPVTNLTIGDPKYRENTGDNWNVTTNNSVTPFTLDATDNYSGVNFTWYTIDGVYFEGTSFDLVGYSEGEHTITWGSEDLAGNNETGNVMIAVLDNSPPSAPIVVGTPKYRDNIMDWWNVTGSTVFTLLPTDTYSGINILWYLNGSGPYFGDTTVILQGNPDGSRVITWYCEDYMGNWQIFSYWVNLDDSPPISDLVVGIPSYRALPAHGWNVTDTTPISISHNWDGSGSGVNFTWYVLDGVYNDYSGPFTLSPGVHTFSWGSEDNLGQNETGNFQIINVDIESPETDLLISLPKHRSGGGDMWNVSNTTIFTLQASDTYSGVNYSWYYIDGEYFVGSSFDLSTYLDGIHTLVWGSIDNLGNNETENSTQVFLDTSPPTTSIIIGSPSYRQSVLDEYNITTATPFTLTPVDIGSGVNVTWYTINGAYYEGTTFDLLGYPDGMYIITWGSIDNSSCNETGNVKTVWVDDSPPLTDLTIGSPKYPMGPMDGINVSSSTQFTLSPLEKPDAHNSGLSHTWYTIDGDYFAGLSFDLSAYGEGSHTIAWGSEDNLGNNETGNIIVIWVDDSMPFTGLSISMPRYPLAPYEGINVSSVSTFILLPSDEPAAHSSGIAETWFIIDGDYYTGTAFDLSGYSEGSHSISWGSLDNLGFNETASNVLVWVDDSEPQTVLDIGNPRFPASPYDGCNVTATTQFNLSAWDEPTHDSGIAKTWYTIDGDYYEGITFDLSSYGEGSHAVTWGSIDNIGNNETGNAITVWLDDSPPVTQMSIGDPKFGNFVTPWTEFTLTPSEKPDAHNSGINYTWYAIDGNYAVGTVFTIGAFWEGEHTITWGSVDNLGQVEITNTITVWADGSHPVTSLDIGTPRYPPSPPTFDESYVTSTTPITLTATDWPIPPPNENVGVDYSWYVIDGDFYIGSSFDFSAYGEGSHTLDWGSIDLLGNNETSIPNTITIYVDDSAPNTLLDSVIPSWGGGGPGYDGVNITSTSQFTLLPTDEPFDYKSGVAYSWYTIDGNYGTGTTFSLSGYIDGPHTVTWGSMDNLGHNESAEVILVWIDDSAPVTDITIGSPRHPSSPFDGCNLTSTTQITLSGTDKPDAHNVGIGYYWYTVDGDFYADVSSFTLSGYNEGSHTITWGATDYLDNTESGNMITVYLDDSYPSSQLTIEQPKFRQDNAHYWNVTIVTNLTISSSDQYSGVDTIWYTIDGEYFEGDIFDLSIYPEGLHTITWGAVDNLGWNETGNLEIVNLNFTSLVTVLDIDPPKHQDQISKDWYVTSSSIFSLTPIVISQEADFTWYTIEGDYYEETTFTLSGYPEGPIELTWGSQDVLGQNESYNEKTVILDDSPPVTALDLSQPSHRNGSTDIWNITHDTQITLTPTDQYSGVNFTWYIVDGIYFEGDSFDLDGYSEEVHTIAWGSMDYLGNNETGNFIFVDVDLSPPSTSMDIDDPRFRNLDTEEWNVTSSTLFSFSSWDSKSGVDVIWYKIDGEYFESDTFTLSGQTQGLHTITWGARDNLGNNETANSQDVILDDGEPLSAMDIGLPKHRVDDTVFWKVTAASSFRISSSDDYSGVDLIWYTIDGDYFEDSEFNLAGYEDGLHVLTYGAIDNLGNNETANPLSVYLDTTEPETELELGTPKYREDDTDPWNVTSKARFTLSPTDEISKVSFTWYMIDGAVFTGTSFDLEGYDDGLYTIRWGSEDNIGNNETGNQMTVNLDNTPPTLSISVGQPNGTINGELHISTSTRLTLSFEDHGVGTVVMYFSHNEGERFFTYDTPFTVPATATSVIFNGKDALDNEAPDSILLVIVDIVDTDGDTIEDIRDTDDDNDGILDVDEDLNGNGVVDQGETDPLNPDTDGDGYDDLKDIYPLDPDRHREPTDWEKLPIVGGMEQGFCLTLLILLIIVIIILFFIIKRYRMYRAGVSWDKEEKNTPKQGK